MGKIIRLTESDLARIVRQVISEHKNINKSKFGFGDMLNVSLFDNKKYNNQKLTDGEKLIFDSGYAYYPTLYFSGSCPNNTLAFQNLDSLNSNLGRSINSLSTSSYISGSSPLEYPLIMSASTQVVSKLFDQVVQGALYMSPGTATSFPTYSVQETGNYSISASVPFTITLPTTPTSSAVWALQVYKSSSSGEQLLYQNVATYNSGNPSNTTLSFTSYEAGLFTFSLTNALTNNLTIEVAEVNGYIGGCGGSVQQTDSILTTITIAAGQLTGQLQTALPMSCAITDYKRGLYISVDGSGPRSSGQTVVVQGVNVLIFIPAGCASYTCV